jgi:POT family proton-dependent oligopeptide transporter
VSAVTSPASAPAAAGQPRDASFFGHPPGLRTLFLTEMWERFSYYGMRAILMLFMIGAVSDGALGFTTEQAAVVYGIYTSLVWLLPLFGGWVADNLLGLRRSILYGGVIIMLGHVCLALHGLSFFFAGLALVVVGTGLLKPNISAIVGQLYAKDDPRRDSGFSLFYMGMNFGSFVAPFVCGSLARGAGFRSTIAGWGIDPTRAWHFGFGAAALGMFLGLVQFVGTGRNLGDVGLQPSAGSDPRIRARAAKKLALGVLAAPALFAGAYLWLHTVAPEELAGTIKNAFAVLLFGSVLVFFVWLFSSKEWSRAQRRKLVVVAILFVGSCIFWGAFEQAGSTLTLFAEKQTDNTVFGWAFDSSYWQSVQPFLIDVLAPLFAWLWMRVGQRDPTSAIRFSLGILCAGLGFAWLVGGAMAAADGARVSPIWLLGVYFLHTIGELLLSPIGLSSMTKFAPERLAGMMIGVFYASISIGTFLGANVAGVYEKFKLPALFAAVAGTSIAMAIVMAFCARPARRLLEAED